MVRATCASRTGSTNTTQFSDTHSCCTHMARTEMRLILYLLFPSNLLTGLRLIKVLSNCAAQQPCPEVFGARSWVHLFPGHNKSSVNRAAQQSRPRQAAQSDCGLVMYILVDMIIAGWTIYADVPCATFSCIGSISWMRQACCVSEAIPDSDAAAAQHITN